jgi:acetolactate synthase small subunit
VILVGSEEEVGIEEQRLMLERVMGALMRQLERETLSSSELDDELLSRINSLLNAIEKATSIYRNLVRLGKRRR